MKKRVLAALKIALVVEGLVILLLSSMKMGMAIAGGDGRVPETGSTPEKESVGGVRADPTRKNIDQKVLKIYKKNRKNLILVNAEHAMKQSDSVFLRTICNGRLQAAEQLYDPLVDMLRDAEKTATAMDLSCAIQRIRKRLRGSIMSRGICGMWE